MPSRPLAALAGLLAISLVACAAPGAPTSPVTPSSPGASAAGGSITVYSGRSEELVAPLIERFTEDTGIRAEVRYGDTAELAALLLEEGERSPADVFFAQDAGALGAVAEAGLFATLPEDVVSRVSEPFRDADGRWSGVSGRSRVLAYDPEDVSEDELPSSVTDLTDPAWSGRIGWVPTNASFQAFVTAFRESEGDAAARAWLEEMLANEPVEYSGNTEAVEGVAADEVDVALVNHYYLLRLKSENGADYPVENHFLEAGDPGALVNVAGVGVLASSDAPDAGQAFADYLLGEDAQSYFAGETFEFPLIEGVERDPSLPALEELGEQPVELNQLADLQGTVDLLREVGVLD
jgi:iron(III) transport system substrate-binding protein